MNRTDSQLLDDQLKRLFGRINYERQNTPKATDFKLANMLELVGRLDEPHLKYPVIHVAGTKGKGSVCTYMGSILTASGLKTGIYTSPHLEVVHQRIAIDGEIIGDQQLLELLIRMAPVIDDMDDRSVDAGVSKLTFFEVITAAAMLHFANEDVDVAILEVGMGGRLDSTNICEPELCVITNVSLDHTQQLGETVDRIAKEKAGIIKSGVPVVSGATHPEVVPVISETAELHTAPLFSMDQDFYCDSQTTGNQDSLGSPRSNHARVLNRFGVRGKVGGEAYEIDELEVGTWGGHQQQNASLAIAAVHILIGNGWSISQENVRMGLRRARLEGRTEVLMRQPTVVVDMAHNVASATALADTLCSEIPEFSEASRRRLLFAASREKDVEGMLLPLGAIFDEICLTQFTSNPRGMPVQDLARIATQIPNSGDTEWLTRPDSRSAGLWCLENMGEKDFTCITGSVFLVAELRPLILQIANDR